MRVALVVPGGVDASGTERVIPALVWLIERLARRHDVYVVAMHQQREPGCWPLLGAQVENVGYVGARRRRFFARFAAAHRAAPFDVVHAIFGSVGLLASLAAWRHRVPFVMHLTGGEPVSLDDIGYGMQQTARGRLALRLALRRARRVTVPTFYMQRLATSLGVASNVVPLGVALDRWPARAPRSRAAGEPARLLHVGDLRPVKDQKTLLAAAHILSECRVDFRLDVAGLDTMDGALQRSITADRVRDRVCWHGLTARPQLRTLVEQADLLLMTSRHEAGPLAVLEAAVAGVPTVGTAVGQVSDWSPDSAIAVPVGDARALADAVRALLADEPRRLSLARAAHERALRCDADATAESFERLYEEVAS